VIIDSHMHVAVPWPFGAVADPLTHGAPARLLAQLDAAGVDAGLLVSAIHRGGDTNGLSVQSEHEHPRRFLAFANLDSMGSPGYQQPGGAARLDTLVERYPGLRGLVQYVRDYAWFDTAEGRGFFARATAHRLVVSIAVFADGIVPLARLALRFPETVFLVHHCGRLATKDRAGAQDETPLRDPAVAAAGNLWFKLSGFHHMAPAGEKYPYAGLHWIFRALYDAVGPRRLVWGSDSPVSDPHLPYAQTLDLFRAHAPFIPAAEKNLILGGNLARLLSWPTSR
jgi:L-fuconolactonase